MPMLGDNAGQFKTVRGFNSLTITAGAAEDDAYQYGPVFDRKGFDGLIANVLVSGVLASGKKVDMSFKIQDCATSNGTFNDYGSEQTYTVNDGSDETGIGQLVASLVGAKRYCKLGIKANLTATGTDTATVSADVILTGARSLPVA